MNCLGVSKKVCLVTGSADCETELTAFDLALVNAKINDLNLIKVSSIVSENAVVVEGLDEEIENASFVPCVMAKFSSNKKGEKITACLGFARLESGLGVIAEKSSNSLSKQELEEKVRKKLELMALNRNQKIIETKIISEEHQVKKHGCVITAAVYVF